MKKECEIVQDLLFGYNDETLRKSSKELVEKHLANCEECQDALKDIQEDTPKEEKNEKEILLAKICNKAEVITSLIDTANVCVRNGIHLGEFVGIIKHPRFVTNGIDHCLGFVISNPHYPAHNKNPHPMMGGLATSIGYEGGGWCGGDFYVNGDGDVICGINHKRFFDLANAFLSEIDKFAEEFYAYIDNLTRE